jgi:hypothetical protein
LRLAEYFNGRPVKKRGRTLARAFVANELHTGADDFYGLKDRPGEEADYAPTVDQFTVEALEDTMLVHQEYRSSL